ncbi:MAG: hypothetical protein RUMPE_00220 [Eubacteriales bacterium SKADARSKE-1]|nr:hypothetical protein [Eubacteriales bacterium SKADARSKE-1]
MPEDKKKEEVKELDKELDEVSGGITRLRTENLPSFKRKGNGMVPLEFTTGVRSSSDSGKNGRIMKY